MKRIILGVIGGLFLSMLALAVFVFISVNFTDAAIFAQGQEDNYPRNLDPFDLLERSLWRFDYFFNPIVVILASVFVAFTTRKSNPLLAVVALAPFFLLYFFANSFSVKSLLFLIAYAIIASFVYYITNSVRNIEVADENIP